MFISVVDCSFEFCLPQSNFLVNDLKYPHIVHVEQESAEEVKHKASSILGTETIDLEGFVKSFHLQPESPTLSFP